MGYWGTIVVARSTDLLVNEPAVSRFGFRHRWLRSLGSGWQMVETSGWDDPPDLAAAAQALAARSGSPVLAGYVCDSDCAALYASAPGAPVSLAHIPDVNRPCTAYKHVPQPSGRLVREVVDDLLAWAGAAGLEPSPDGLRRAVGHETETAAGYRSADDLVFDVVAALGFDHIGVTIGYRFDVNRPPFSRITDGLAGLGKNAYARASYRRYDLEYGLPVDEPEEPWEAEAVALAEQVWTAVYDPAADVADLARRAAWVEAAYQAAREGRPEPVDDRSVVGDQLHAALVAGTLNPATYDYARQAADERARPARPDPL